MERDYFGGTTCKVWNSLQPAWKAGQARFSLLELTSSPVHGFLLLPATGASYFDFSVDAMSVCKRTDFRGLRSYDSLH